MNTILHNFTVGADSLMSVPLLFKLRNIHIRDFLITPTSAGNLYIDVFLYKATKHKSDPRGLGKDKKHGYYGKYNQSANTKKAYAFMNENYGTRDSKYYIIKYVKIPYGTTLNLAKNFTGLHFEENNTLTYYTLYVASSATSTASMTFSTIVNYDKK